MDKRRVIFSQEMDFQTIMMFIGDLNKKNTDPIFMESPRNSKEYEENIFWLFFFVF